MHLMDRKVTPEFQKERVDCGPRVLWKFSVSPSFMVALPDVGWSLLYSRHSLQDCHRAGRDWGAEPSLIPTECALTCFSVTKAMKGRQLTKEEVWLLSTVVWRVGKHKCLTLEEGLKPRDRWAQGRCHRINALLHAGHTQVQDGFGVKAVLFGNKNSGFGLNFLKKWSQIMLWGKSYTHSMGL